MCKVPVKSCFRVQERRTDNLRILFFYVFLSSQNIPYRSERLYREGGDKPFGLAPAGIKP